jgi:hypothetical protein
MLNIPVLCNKAEVLESFPSSATLEVQLKASTIIINLFLFKIHGTKVINKVMKIYYQFVFPQTLEQRSVMRKDGNTGKQKFFNHKNHCHMP